MRADPVSIFPLQSRTRNVPAAANIAERNRVSSVSLVREIPLRVPT
jgi:hypothetical protein